MGINPLRGEGERGVALMGLEVYVFCKREREK
jgi:hypothetical protein